MGSARRAVVLDLDGTLVDTAPDLLAALDHVLTEATHAEIDSLDLRRFVGGGARALVERGCEALGLALSPAGREARLTAFLAYYADNLSHASRPFAGVAHTLAGLAADGARLGVCTNKPEGMSRRLLGELGLGRHFAAIIGGDSLPVRKPDPRHVLETIARIGASASEAVMVGDSMNDVAAAHAAGVPVIVVAYGYGATPSTRAAADTVIASFAELPAALAGLP